jgi:hypothetical protein
MISPLSEDTQDAVQWWQAYLLAENDQADELRERATAGDEHARRQLAGWLADRARTDEAIELIRPLADTGDDIAQLWLARWLAERDQLDELRQRAGAGGYYALLELAGWLADHERFDQVRELVAGQRALLSSWLATRHELELVRLAADLGDDDARRRLTHWLVRLRERASRGDSHAQQLLAGWDD